MSSPWHLTRRFVGSLWPFGPSTGDTLWAHEHLLAGERTLWDRMSAPDRRHSHGVARRVDQLLDQPSREVIAAALLHDVGKLESGLGTFRRVAATLSAAVAGRETAELWVRSSGVTRRIGLYLTHPAIGGDMLEMADADPLTSAWAREHHLPEEQWTVPVEIGRALRDADDD